MSAISMEQYLGLTAQLLFCGLLLILIIELIILTVIYTWRIVEKVDENIEGARKVFAKSKRRPQSRRKQQLNVVRTNGQKKKAAQG